jgi:hypothetical protein
VRVPDISVFTEEEVDLCLDAAAMMRRSYLGPGGVEHDEYADRYAEARAWDELARKIAATIPGLELERQCRCNNGLEYGYMCLDCLGTGLLPPTPKTDHE